MVNENQHQQPLEHALDHAKSAICGAQEAERFLYDASLQADPHELHQAQAKIHQAEEEVKEAMRQLIGQSHPSFEQQIVQTREELLQAKQDLRAAESRAHQPRQVR